MSAVTSPDVDQMRENVEAHLRAAGVRPILVSRAAIDSQDLAVYLQSTFGEHDLALTIVREIDGVRSAEFRPDTNRSILSVVLTDF